MESISELFARKSEKPKVESSPVDKANRLEQIRSLFERNDKVEDSKAISIMRRPKEPVDESSYKKALIGDTPAPKKETQLDTRDWNLISDDE
jgi:hypothetical protein